MHDSDKAVFRAYLLQAAEGVFGSCSIPAELEETFDPSELGGSSQIAAFIGFSGPVVRGTLTLVAPTAVLREAHPVPLTGGEDSELLDWTGELANLLLGRLRNKLVAHALEFHPSTPKALFADDVRAGSASPTVVAKARYRTTGGSIGVWLDAVAPDGVVLCPDPPVDAGCIEEGDLVLF